MSQTPLLTLRGIDKRFGPRQVLFGAGLSVARGEVHALLGENGAGKSTLMNILTGVYSADAGELWLDGQRRLIRKPADASALGIGMVHQHYRLVERFSAAQNLLLAAGKQHPWRTESQAAQALQDTAARIGLELNTTTPIAELSVAERQRAEICKVLALGARLLVLDEPTAVLTDREAQTVLAAIARMAEQGLGVILITHKLREVIGHSHRVSIMRQGHTVAHDLDTASLSIDAIATLMVGEQAGSPQRAPSNRQAHGPDLLIANNLSVARADGGVGVSDISLRVRAGEVLGIAGVGGNGQQQLADALLGLLPIQHGDVSIDGASATDASIARRRQLGLRIIPSDRMASGLVAELSVQDNLALTQVHRGRFGRLWLRRRALHQQAVVAIENQEIAGASAQLRTSLLSGGNAQKVLLARELDPELRVLVAHSPTRGLDVRACAMVHAAIRQATARGAACLLISEDLEEVMALADRIAVISAGRLVGECAGDASAQHIGALMLGHA